MSEWFKPPQSEMPAPPTSMTTVQQTPEEAGLGRSKRKYRGPLMAMADEDLMLSQKGKTKLGA